MEKLDEGTLLTTLNSLLASLELPISLESTLDLTPSVILGVIESMLRTRLAIPPQVRKSNTRTARIDSMKIFLGILGDDVLGITAGIDRIDPVRLADGMPEETTRIAQLFCWLGKRMNYIADDGSYSDERVAPRGDSIEGHGNASLSPSMTADTTVDSRLSMHSGQAVSDDQTTVMADESFVLDTESNVEEEQDVVGEGQSVESVEVQTSSHSRDEPRCIHELSFITPSAYTSHTSRLDPTTCIDDSIDSYCDCPTGINESSVLGSRSIRQDGWISPVRLEDELHSFEATRKASKTSRVNSLNFSIRAPETPLKGRPITRHTSPSQHTLALLNEKAKLLEELARLKSDRSCS